MQCSRCGSENREGSNFCRYCATPLTAEGADPGSGYIPSVPPPVAQKPGEYYPPSTYQPPPPHPAHRPAVGQLTCPRCGSISVMKGGTPQWAIIVSIVGLLIVCIFSLFFLLIKDPNRCLNCGLEFR
jgi:Double zinc ribbon